MELLFTNFPHGKTTECWAEETAQKIPTTARGLKLSFSAETLTTIGHVCVK